MKIGWVSAVPSALQSLPGWASLRTKELTLFFLKGTIFFKSQRERETEDPFTHLAIKVRIKPHQYCMFPHVF